MPTNLPTTAVVEWSAQIVPPPAESASAFGTNRQRFVRIGQHWRFTVTLPAQSQSTALDWTDLEAPTDTMVWEIPQGDLQAGNEGTPLVDGGGQLGSTLDVDGITPGYVIKKGAFISVISSSRRYVYQVTAEATATGLGEAALSIQPPLRVSPNNNDTVEIATPKVEGLSSADPLTIGLSYVQRGRRFVIEERG